MWAGGTESQFVVERKFICELHNTSLKFNIRVNFFMLYMFWYILCLVALFKGRYHTNYFTNKPIGAAPQRL